MEDMYCDNDYINLTPTLHSVLITSESGDELVSLREQFIGRAERHLLQHVPRAKLVDEQYFGTCGMSSTHWTLWKVVFGLDSVEGRVRTAHTVTESRGCQ